MYNDSEGSFFTTGLERQLSDMYAEDGVNVEAGDSFSAIAGRLCRSTYGNCRFVRIHDLSLGSFRGPRPFSLTEGLGLMFDAGPDGVGTKVLLHDALMTHRFAARDLLAMTIGDLTRFGGLPAVFWNILGVKSLGEPGTPRFNLFVGVLEELVKAANEIGVVVHKGETAEKGACVGTDNPHANAPFDWEGVSYGIFRQDKMIYGDRVQPGDVVIALREDGFRSNGISSVRAAFERHYGPNYYSLEEAREDLLAAVTPSVLYDRMLATANGWFEENLQSLIDVRLIAHITGGGFKKFSELLEPTGLSATLYDLFDLPGIMRSCADWRGFGDRQVYDTWNGGQGMLVVVPPHEVQNFLDHSAKFGITAQVCGDITPSAQTTVTLVSKYNGGKLLFGS